MDNIKFRKVSNELIEVYYEGIINIVSINEAKELGYTEFTYQSKPITYTDFAKLIGKSKKTVASLVNKYNYTTGEQIIEYYKNRFTYQGKPITISAFAELINSSIASVSHLIYAYGYTTGEQIIDYYKNKPLTYQGKPITYTDFAKLINKSNSATRRIAQRHNFTTGEQIIDYYKKCKENRFTYQGKPITYADFAKLINKTTIAVRTLAYKYSYTTGEQIIEHYIKLEQDKQLTYQGAPITYADFAKLINKSDRTINALTNKYCYTTGEQIIEHYRKLEQNKPLTYQCEPISYVDFAKLINKSYTTVYKIAYKYGYTTGEEIIEHYKMKGKL